MHEPTYTISADGQSITCHRCGLTSYHPMDVSQRYCGQCRMFHTDAAANADLIKENADLRRRLESCMHAGDMEHARMASLLGATTDLLNVLATLRYPDMSSLWTIGGSSLENAVVALKRSAEAVRPQADAFLQRLADCQRANAEVAQLNGDELIALSAAYDALMSYAHGNGAPGLALEVAALVLATIEQARE